MLYHFLTLNEESSPAKNNSELYKINRTNQAKMKYISLPEQK